MASTASRSSVRLSRQTIRHYRTQKSPSLTCPLGSTSRTFATSAPRPSEEAATEAPRWSYTPERMKAPFPIGTGPKRYVAKTPWLVNEDPKKLDNALNTFLGCDGDRLLSDDLKWLAVTHKSFDQARRGFNDRIGFLGRQICIMEAMQSIINSPPHYDSIPLDPYADKRQPFENSALRSLDNLYGRQPLDIFKIEKVAKLALATGLAEVVRWRPRMPDNIVGSGLHPVLTGAVYAIIGAIALHNGGKIANKIARERVLRKLSQ
ncbi:RNase III domain-containing protein [Xylaria nigripes]|nr:RNase III domain-containing protein [Xylaria nigripes]